MSEMNITDLVDDYCKSDLLDLPESTEEYIRYAKRFVDVALISKSEYDDFVMSTTENKDITNARFPRIP